MIKCHTLSSSIGQFIDTTYPLQYHGASGSQSGWTARQSAGWWGYIRGPSELCVHCLCIEYFCDRSDNETVAG